MDDRADLESGTEWRVRVGDDEVSVALDRAPATTGRVFALAHGAGGHMADRGVMAAAATLRRCGLDVLRFNFPYSERKSRRPDPMPRLTACVASVVASARERAIGRRWIIGGRSMGGRAASMLAAEGFAADGLLLLAYPLHPADAPEKRRDAHLARIAMPVLCFNGTRDALCRRDLMDAAVSRLGPNWTMHWLDGADHAFHVLRASGRRDADVQEEIRAAAERWLTRMPR